MRFSSHRSNKPCHSDDRTSYGGDVRYTNHYAKIDTQSNAAVHAGTPAYNNAGVDAANS